MAAILVVSQIIWTTLCFRKPWSLNKKSGYPPSVRPSVHKIWTPAIRPSSTFSSIFSSSGFRGEVDWNYLRLTMDDGRKDEVRWGLICYKLLRSRWLKRTKRPLLPHIKYWDKNVKADSLSEEKTDENTGTNVRVNALALKNIIPSLSVRDKRYSFAPMAISSCL